jgi:hypothetical protein
MAKNPVSLISEPELIEIGQEGQINPIHRWMLRHWGEAVLGEANPPIGISDVCQAKRWSQILSTFWDSLDASFH